MEVRKVTDRFTVSPQIQPGDLEAVAAAGFVGVINNRPDDEEPGQPASSVVSHAAAGLGLSYSHIPISGSTISDGDIASFRTALGGAGGPVFAFCRTGTRSIRLWALANAGRYDADEIITLAARAGYDLAQLRPLLEKS